MKASIVSALLYMMIWNGGVEQKGKAMSSVVFPEVHVPLYKGMMHANSTNISVKAVFAVGYCCRIFLPPKMKFVLES